MNQETAIIMKLWIFCSPACYKQKGSTAPVWFTASALARQVFTNKKISFQISLPVPWIFFCYLLKSQEQTLFSSYHNSTSSTGDALTFYY